MEGHDTVKYKILYLMSLYKDDKGFYYDISCRELVRLTGCNHKSLRVLLARWDKWGYVRRTGYGPEIGYQYKILTKGEWFVKRAHRFLNTDELQKQIITWQQSQNTSETVN
jgi:hypothetical protein